MSHGYGVAVIADDELPEAQDWVWVETDGPPMLYIKRSVPSRHVPALAHAGRRSLAAMRARQHRRSA